MAQVRISETLWEIMRVAERERHFIDPFVKAHFAQDSYVCRRRRENFAASISSLLTQPQSAEPIYIHVSNGVRLPARDILYDGNCNIKRQ